MGGQPPTEACQCQQQADRLTKTQAPAAGATWPARWMEVMEGEPTHRGRANQAIQQGAADSRDDLGQQAPRGGWPLLCHGEVPEARLIARAGRDGERDTACTGLASPQQLSADEAALSA